MTFENALRRAIATFVFGALSVPFSASVLDIEAWKAALAAGIAAVLNYAYRVAEAYLENQDEVINGQAE